MKQSLRHGARVVVAVSLIFVVSMGAFCYPAHAETPTAVGLAVSPPLFELTANPGETLTQSIRIDNLTHAPLELNITNKNFVPLGEEGQSELTDKPTEFLLSEWIKPETTALVIDAKSSKTLSFKIIVPGNAEPGGHFGSLVIHTSPQPDGQNTVISQEIGALILLKVAGQVTEKASIVSFKSSRDLWRQGPVEVVARIKNEGNVQLKPVQTVTISNGFGQKVASFNVDSRTVLPGSIRRIPGTWGGSPWPGIYTATLSVSYGDNPQLLTSSTRFIIFPYHIVLPALVILGAIGYLSYRGRARLLRSLRILLGKE